MKIEVLLNNLTPIFSAAAGVSSVALDGTINPPGGGFPLTRARTQGVIAVDETGSRRVVAVPTVPANSMRNLLRRTMLKHVLEPALKGRVQLSINAYAAAYAGSATGNPDGVASSFDEIVTMRSHPFIGLFGGGPRMLEGRLMVDNLWPLHTSATRVIGEGLEDRLVSGKITDIIWTRRCDPVAALHEAEDAAIIKNGVDEANNWIAGLLEKTKSAKKSKGSKEAADAAESEKGSRGLRAFNAHEVVVPGLEWYWRMNAVRPTDAQVGLILVALSNLTQERIAGGHAKNYGNFCIDDVKLNGESVWHAGSLNDQVCMQYIDALAEALEGMSADDFEQFAASSKGA